MALTALAQRIQALAQTGLTYAKDAYDRERYEELRAIASELLAVDPKEQEALRGMFAREIGYATPKVDVRAVVLHEGGLLLARESEDRLWSLPGGWADVGDRPSSAAEREVREETGMEVRATRLLGVWDRNLHGHPPHAFHIYKLFLLCEVVDGELRPGHDTLDAAFFPPGALPPLSLSRIVPEEIEACLRAAADPSLPAYFD